MELRVPSGDAARNTVVVSISLLITQVLSGVQALLLVFLADAGDATDAYLAAYAVYMPVAALAASMRSSALALVGRLGTNGGFRDRVIRVLSECAAVGLVAAVVLAVSTPVARTVFAGDVPGDARSDFVVSMVILAVAAYLHVHAALLSAALTAGRRFAFSAGAYAVSSCFALAVSAALLPAVGVVGAAIGTAAGALALAATHVYHASRFGITINPLRGVRAGGVLVGRAMHLIGNAALGWSTQLGLAVSLATLPNVTGAITAYTYAFFVMLLMLNVTSLPIGLVRLPEMLTFDRSHDLRAFRDELVRSITLSEAVLVPLIATFLAFGQPLIDIVFGTALDASSRALIYDVGAWLCLLACFSVLHQLGHATAVALGRWRASVAVNAGGVAVLTLVLLGLNQPAPETVAACHAMVTSCVAIVLIGVLFRRGTASLLLAVARRSAPAIGLGLVLLLPRAVVGADPPPGLAIGGALVGLGGYAILTAVLWPDVARPFTRVMRGRSPRSLAR